MFFLIFVLVYGGLQAYVMSRAAAAWGWRGRRRGLALVWAGFMAVAPLLLWQLEHCPCRELARVAAWLVYGWMGFSFLLFWLALTLQLYTYLAGRAGWPRPAPARGYAGVSGLAAGLCLYGLTAAWQPRVEQLRLGTPKLPAGTVLRIVQISDVHLGPMIGARRLAGMLASVRALQPDILVSTGDLLDGRSNHLEGTAELLADLRPPLGKYAITGNHEYIMGIDAAVAFHARAGFQLLRGQALEVAPGLILAGVDDPGRHRPGIADPGRPADTDGGPLLARLPRDRYVLFLKHQPRPPDEGFDLQLSGHTHAGQIFPFRLLVRLVYPHVAGDYLLPHGGMLHVSRGTGTWGPPIRLGAPPEITLIELRSTVAPAATGQR